MRTATLAPQVQADILSAVFAGAFPADFWNCQDDLCDCTYQRIGMWTNPYMAETLEVRLCCIWAEFQKQYPEFVRVTPAFLDGNAKEWVPEPAAWNAEADMPKAIWYRQLARQQDRPVAEIRAEYADKDHLRPKGMARRQKVPFLILVGGEEVAISL